jgi:tetratricopeptide (TPR) repeat protein
MYDKSLPCIDVRRRAPTAWVTITLTLLGLPLLAAAAPEVALPAPGPVLQRFAQGTKEGSTVWWLAPAEEQAGLWGNPFQQSHSLEKIAEILADRGRIEAACAVAGRIRHGPALLSARYRIAAAYVRAGKLEAAHALARRPLKPGGAVEPDAALEITCRIALALAKAGRIGEAEKVATMLRNPPAELASGEAKVASVRARVHAQLAVAHAKAGRSEAYRKHLEDAEALAGSIPGDLNEMWGRLGSSSSKAHAAGGPDPINVIYKGAATRSIVMARVEAGLGDVASGNLEVIPPGRRPGAVAREVVKRLADAGSFKAARAAAEAIATRDHQEIAFVSIAAAYADRGDLKAARELASSITDLDRRMVARLHVAAAKKRRGTAVDFDTMLDPSRAGFQVDPALKEAWARKGRGQPPTSTAPRLRAKTYRELARIQAGVRDRTVLLAWIRALPDATSRFYAFLGAAEG